MPQYAAGINIDKACVLIAMDRMFDPSEWGREFIHDYFEEFGGEDGFCTDHFYLLEESAPIMKLPLNGMWQVAYKQGDTYLRIIHHETLTRYRLTPDRVMIYVYKIDDNTSHAVAIFVDELPFYISKTEFVTMLLPTEGLIVDHAKGLE